MLLASSKSLLYLSSILLVGAGVYARFLLPQTHQHTRLTRTGVMSGTIIIIISSALELVLTLMNVLGYVKWGLLQRYLLGTQHGHALLFRVALALMLAALLLIGFRFLRSVWLTGGFLLLGAALLLTFSWTSHGAVMAGWQAMMVDWLHFVSAASWGGAIVYLAVSPIWQHKPPDETTLRVIINRVSTLGLIAVSVLFASGIYSSLLHLSDPPSFARSPYGYALFIKLAFIMIIIMIAAYNRLHLKPNLNTMSQQLKTFIRIEAFVLILIFISTGTLTTSALPHSANSSTSVSQNFQTLIQSLRR